MVVFTFLTASLLVVAGLAAPLAQAPAASAASPSPAAVSPAASASAAAAPPAPPAPAADSVSLGPAPPAPAVTSSPDMTLPGPMDGPLTGVSGAPPPQPAWGPPTTAAPGQDLEAPTGLGPDALGPPPPPSGPESAPAPAPEVEASEDGEDMEVPEVAEAPETLEISECTPAVWFQPWTWRNSCDSEKSDY